MPSVCGTSELAGSRDRNGEITLGSRTVNLSSGTANIKGREERREEKKRVKRRGEINHIYLQSISLTKDLPRFLWNK